MVMSRNPQVQNGLLIELAKEEAALGMKVQEWDRVRSELEVVRRRYAAVRDAATNYIGAFPYEPGIVWPPETQRIYFEESPYNKGQFRFVGMPLGDAIVAALKEADEALTSAELVERLAAGYLRTNIRAVHAAAINTAGVVKQGDVYKYIPPEPDPDDLPF